MATYPHFSKAELARRLNCSRRAIVNWCQNPEFMDKVRELRKTIRPNVPSLVGAMTKAERKELLRRLKQEFGVYLPEIEKIERLLFDQTTGQIKDFEMTRKVISRLDEIKAADAETMSIEDLSLSIERLESEMERKLPGWRDQKPEAEVFPRPVDEEATGDESNDIGDEELEDYLEDQRASHWEKPDLEWEEDDWD